MQQLIDIQLLNVGRDLLQTVNARELHAFLQVGKVFAAWIQERIQQYGFVQDTDYVLTVSKTGIRSNVIQKDYHLTLDMAKELAMIENNEIGRAVRRYFIAREKTARQNPAIPHLITTDQAGEIRTLIDERFPDGRHRPYAWSRFNNHFRISGYKNLPASRFEEACAYIPTMPRKEEEANADLIALLKSRRWLLTHDAKGLMRMSEVPNEAFVLTEKEIHQHLEAHGHAIVKKDEWVRRADLLQLLSA